MGVTLMGMILLFILVMVLFIGGFVVFIAANASTSRDEWLGSKANQSSPEDRDSP
jgi:hypothetical protein